MLDHSELIVKATQEDLTPLEEEVYRIYEAKAEARKKGKFSKAHKLGFYEHFKGGKYELMDIGLNSANGTELVCVYKNLKNGKVWVRNQLEFFEYIWKDGVEVQRFKLITPLPTQLQQFVAFLRQHYEDWLKLVEHNPAQYGKTVGDPYKYIVGDKIAFTASLRLITKKQAEILISWLNHSWKQNRLIRNESEIE